MGWEAGSGPSIGWAGRQARRMSRLQGGSHVVCVHAVWSDIKCEA